MPKDDKFIQHTPLFGYEQFKGKSCFEIYHLEACKGLWYPDRVESIDKDGKKTIKCEIRVRQTHEMYKKLRALYEIPNNRKGRKQSQNAQDTVRASNSSQEARIIITPATAESSNSSTSSNSSDDSDSKL